MLDGLSQLTRIAPARPLEHHVFKKVRPTRLALVLEARAAIDEGRQGKGLQARHRVDEQAQAIVEGVQRLRRQDMGLRHLPRALCMAKAINMPNITQARPNQVRAYSR